MIRLICFDLDGVLIDTYPIMAMATERAWAESGGCGEFPRDGFFCHQGAPLVEIAKRLDLPPGFVPAYRRLAVELIDHARAIDGMNEVLDWLSAEAIDLAVITGKEAERAGQLLDRFGLARYFPVVVAGDGPAAPKPAPDGVQYVMRRLDVPPADTIMVGDAPFDIMAGRGAGTITAGALWATIKPEELVRSDPDLLLNRPGDLVRVIRAGATAPLTGRSV